MRQASLAVPPEWRRQVLSGGYWLRDDRTAAAYAAPPHLHLLASGVMLAEALAASDAALADDIDANVIHITSHDGLTERACPEAIWAVGLLPRDVSPHGR